MKGATLPGYHNVLGYAPRQSQTVVYSQKTEEINISGSEDEEDDAFSTPFSVARMPGATLDGLNRLSNHAQQSQVLDATQKLQTLERETKLYTNKLSQVKEELAMAQQQLKDTEERERVACESMQRALSRTRDMLDRMDAAGAKLVKMKEEIKEREEAGVVDNTRQSSVSKLETRLRTAAHSVLQQLGSEEGNGAMAVEGQ